MQWLIRSALLCALLGIGSLAESAPAPAAAPLAVGSRVPDFTVRDLAGKTRTLSDLQKESPSGVVVLSYWNSACHCCREMEGRLDALAAAMRGKAAVAALDATRTDTAQLVKSYAAKRGLSLPMLLDSRGQVAKLFGVRYVTTTVVIDGKGILRYRGQFDRGRVTYARDALQAILAGKEIPRVETEQEGCPVHP